MFSFLPSAQSDGNDSLVTVWRDRRYRPKPTRESPKKKRPGAGPPGPRFSVSDRSRYSADSTGLVCATVQSGAPTLKRAKRRTVMFSPSLPTFCAINSFTLMA